MVQPRSVFGATMRMCILALLAALVAGLALLSAAVRASGTTTTGPVWHVQCVDCPKLTFQIGDRSLALDAAGRPHLAYADDVLAYVRLDGAVWHREIVDAAPGIDDLYQSSVSLALNAGGIAYISYLSTTSSTLKVAYRTPLGWQVETVDAAGDVGQYTDLALDPADTPHISYYDASHGDLRYAIRAAGQWQVETVDAAGDVGLHTSLALDTAGRPVIAYGSADNGELRYAWWDGAAWNVQIVLAGRQAAAVPSLALDSQDRPRLSFYDPGWHALRLAWGEPFGQYLPLVIRTG